MHCPRPGDTHNKKIVVASGWVNDDRIGLMLLNNSSPYYEISEWDELGQVWSTNFMNIVPAAEFFNKQFGFWGESE